MDSIYPTEEPTPPRSPNRIEDWVRELRSRAQETNVLIRQNYSMLELKVKRILDTFTSPDESLTKSMYAVVGMVAGSYVLRNQSLVTRITFPMCCLATAMCMVPKTTKIMITKLF